MLGSRTKQVHSYGRRGRRIVNASVADTENPLGQIRKPALQEALDFDSKQEGVGGVPPNPVLPHPRALLSRKKTEVPPKNAKVTAATSVRRPLVALASNVPSSTPSHGRRRKGPSSGKGIQLKQSPPHVNVDIIILDNDGRRVSSEKRVLRNDVQISRGNKTPARSLKIVEGAPEHDPIIISDSEDDTPLARPPRKRHFAPIIISSDEESDADTPRGISSHSSTPPVKPPRHRSPLKPRNTVITPPSSPSVKAHSPPNMPTTQQIPRATTPTERSRPRALTPIRTRMVPSSIFPAPPSPLSPTTPTDFDQSLAFDLAQLALSPRTIKQLKDDQTSQDRIPKYLYPLLEECGQSTPYEFSAFIEMFPFDPLVNPPQNAADGGIPELQSAQTPATFQKIGEASYSEVFGIGGVVLKIIPLRDEDARLVEDSDVDTPAPSDSKDVLREVIVTRAIGEAHNGFTKLLRTYVVRGKYPSLLLNLWDDFDERKGSESVRPDTFSVSQLYAIIVLPNGGPDLQAFTFPTPTKTGWKQACSLFWQVTRALAEAEELVRFEHRDLHWGQILVKETKPLQKRTRRPKGVKYPMDHETHGVKATIIDLGLARMDTHDGRKNETYWTPFEEEIFEGEGDYQFDIYRMMRSHNKDTWNSFCPVSNVMWLHYLVDKLLHAKGIRPPTRGKSTAPSTVSAIYTERECYQCLIEMESALSDALTPWKARPTGKGRRKTTQVPDTPVVAGGPKTAGDVLQLGIVRNWVS